ncbi:MAG: hypothetical protein AB1414_14010 [bacterium]
MTEWKKFMMGCRLHPGHYEQHILPLDKIEQFDYPNIPPNINRYILRTIDIDVVISERQSFVFSKLGRFIILGFIEMPQPRQWEGTKVHINRGVIWPRDYLLPAEFGDYLMDKAQRLVDIQASISDKQNEKIRDTYLENIDKIAESESFKAMDQDVLLFGNEAFKKDNKRGRKGFGLHMLQNKVER